MRNTSGQHVASPLLTPLRITKSMADFAQWQQVTVDVSGCYNQQVVVRSRRITPESPSSSASSPSSSSASSSFETGPPANSSISEQAEWYNTAYPITCWAWLADPHPISVQSAQAQVQEQILSQKDSVSHGISRAGEILSEETYLAYDAIGIGIRHAFDEKRTEDSAAAHAQMLVAEKLLSGMLLNMTNEFAELSANSLATQQLMIHMTENLIQGGPTSDQAHQRSGTGYCRLQVKSTIIVGPCQLYGERCTTRAVRG
jgi:hypothetical protein